MRNTYSFFLKSKKHWHSKWYADANYRELVHQDLAVRDYLSSVLKQNSLIYNRAVIKRDNKHTTIYIRVYDQSYGIRQEGTQKTIKKQKSKKNRRTQRTSIFTKHPLVYKAKQLRNKTKIEIDKRHLDHIKRNISELTNTTVRVVLLVSPRMDAEMICQFTARLIERRKTFNSITRLLQNILKENKRIQGIRIQCSGRPTGKPMAFIQCFKNGPIAPSTCDANVDYAHTTAWTKFGVCGIKVWINFHR